jgi:hypothetical protein
MNFIKKLERAFLWYAKDTNNKQCKMQGELGLGVPPQGACWVWSDSLGELCDEAKASLALVRVEGPQIFGRSRESLAPIRIWRFYTATSITVGNARKTPFGKHDGWMKNNKWKFHLPFLKKEVGGLSSPKC